MEKLYERDPYLAVFQACVVSCTSEPKGWAVVLDQTAFFPEGGGQPSDTGALSGIPVTQVHERDGQVVHTCSAPLAPGAQVEGRIDWPRRFDLMQQHSGEHVVSGLIHAKYGYDNVGFHLGSDTVTIDFNGPLDEAGMAEIEAQANHYLWQDHPVQITVPAPQELERLEYRSKKQLSGPVRIVSFPGADTCACCGTHVSTSGQVGLIKLLSCQKFRGGSRLELLCGGRALAYLSRIAAENHRISMLLSAKPMETSVAVQRLYGELQTLKTRAAHLENARFAGLAQAFAGQGDVLLFEDGLSPDGLRRLADAVLSVCGGRCACFSGNDTDGYQYAVGQRDHDLRPLVQALNQACGGRGGGRPDFAQGAVHASRSEIEAFFAR